jgi:hypothetical protein
MRPVDLYLTHLQAARSTGASTPETSYYPALHGLLNAVGQRLKPAVTCVMNLRNAGAGLPDGGLFTADQLDPSASGVDAVKSALQAVPSRGAIEVKAPTASMQALAASAQVAAYAERYRHVLLTNLREFWLVERDEGKNLVRERFVLASSEAELWRLAAHPGEAAARGDALLEFLERVLRTPAPLAAPEDVAWFLASYARDALRTIENAPTGALEDIAETLGEALGVGFGDAKGRHFFHSTLVQTLFYGVFSAWVLWGQSPRAAGERFSWRDTTDLLHLPILKVLFHEMTRPTQLFTNVLRERLDLAESALRRVDRSAFYKRFPQHEAVQYFYEPFLEAFDAELRKQLGVWYTPDEVVRYMVERVDRALREDLGLADGLADPSVLVLDPACGTGAFLLAVLERIAQTLKEKGVGATLGARLVDVVTQRLHGFEILPAPFVIAHLQLALYLQRTGVTLPAGRRVGVYLTNALTGWGRPQGRRPKLPQEFADERAAAGHVKQKAPVLVVLGNPPYNAFAGIQPREEQESVDVYKTGLSAVWRVRKYNLDDLFVRFFRLAERKIAEQAGRGVVCFISSASYAADPSFVVMRERFLHGFDSVTIDNLNGDSRETGKVTPDGLPDPSVFSTPRNREGIRVGTAVGLFVRRGEGAGKSKRGVAAVRWREFWGANKRQALLDSLKSDGGYAHVATSARQRWSLRPQSATRAYRRWASALELGAHDPISGLAEKRHGALIAMERGPLEARLKAYFDAGRKWASVRPQVGDLAKAAADYVPEETRARLVEAGRRFDAANIRRYALLPLDTRWCYLDATPPLWNRARPALARHASAENRFLNVRLAARRVAEGIPVYAAGALPDHHLLDPNVVSIPMRWRSVQGNDPAFEPNLSPLALAYLTALGVTRLEDEGTATLVWFHYLAVTHAPRYLRDNGEAVRADVPRVPLPAQRATLEASARLGRRVADLLDPDRPVTGVTSGPLDPSLRPLGELVKVGGGMIDPAQGDLAVARRWGTLQRETVVMPGVGHRTPATLPEAHPLGTSASDLWLNEQVCWRAVPDAVWEFSIGGYPVLKKWLSYREKSVLGRDLTLDEADHFTSMVRRIAAVVLLGPELDALYASSAAEAWFPPTPVSPAGKPKGRAKAKRSPDDDESGALDE